MLLNPQTGEYLPDPPKGCTYVLSVREEARRTDHRGVLKWRRWRIGLYPAWWVVTTNGYLADTASRCLAEGRPVQVQCEPNKLLGPVLVQLVPMFLEDEEPIF